MSTTTTTTTTTIIIIISNLFILVGYNVDFCFWYNLSLWNSAITPFKVEIKFNNLKDSSERVKICLSNRPPNISFYFWTFLYEDPHTEATCIPSSTTFLQRAEACRGLAQHVQLLVVSVEHVFSSTLWAQLPCDFWQEWIKLHLHASTDLVVRKDPHTHIIHLMIACC
jgi:hypothetical protein